MFSRRISELATKPFSLIKSFTQNPFLRSHTVTSSLNTQEKSQNSKNEHHEEQHSNNNNNNNSHEYTYNSNRRFYYAPILPLLAIMTTKLHTAHCFFSSTKPEKNVMTSRISLIQYPSNHPIEDRWAVAQLESIPGFVTMVFDGHGGWQAAEFAREKLPLYLDEILRENKNKTYSNEDEYYTTALRLVFDRIESEFFNACKAAYDAGFATTANVGACALVALVANNKVYAANAGDCQGVICRNEGGKVSVIKVNKKLNANSKKEQARLKQQFTDEDIFTCKRGDPKACYVKSRLQPTHAFGDFRLKSNDFNDPKNLGKDLGYRMKIEKFNGPYITHVPQIRVLDLTKNDKYLILSSDGMWDELTKPDVAGIVERNLGDKQKITTELLNTAIQTAAKNSNMTEPEIRNLSVGHRRRYHDDMTIIVVDLENQSK